MPMLTVAAAVINQTPLDWDGNQSRILAVLAAARAEHVGLLCLPELCITGYGCEDAFHGPDTAAQAERVLAEILPATTGLAVCVGLPVLHHRALFNAVAMLVDGRLVGLAAKQHLAGDGIHYEQRWFKPWPGGVAAQVPLLGHDVPIGDLLFEIGGVRIGFEICEDAWVAARSGSSLAMHGADLILNPSASHFAFAKTAIRHGFVTEGSRAFGCTYIYANLLGNEAGRAIYDGGALIAHHGRLIARGPRLTFADWHLTRAIVDIGASRLAQSRSASYSPACAEFPGLVRSAHRWPAVTGVPSEAPEPQPAWEDAEERKAEEFTRAEALALADYLRKSRHRGFVVSLSGGCDSAAVVCLIAIMVRLACQELGIEGLRRRFPHIPALASGADPAAITRILLTTVYQATAQSGAVTRAAAQEVAAAIGARHLVLELGDLVAAYTQLVGAALGRQPDWSADDLALQNIQARTRAPSVWLIANLEGKLLLSTSNRSEAAVGYATMDGDTCGGLSPIAGIDKAYLRTWLAWLERVGPHGMGPIPALACVTRQASTPELRPRQAGQHSEDDLMPFPVLDRIERWAIRDKLPPKAVLPRLVAAFPEHAAADLRGWVERFYTLWCRNQWKRERLAPAFHLDDENLDPKTWCRFPILSGGFARELGELPPA